LVICAASATRSRMKAKSARTSTDIDDYITGFPPKIRAMLQKVRATIRKAAPGAAEKISYRIPTFTLRGNLVHFAAFKNHIGFFPTSTGIARFKKELASYKTAKGSAQFPFERPIPFALITRIVKFRVKENLQRAKAKGTAGG
jgi:uncharacterized protein YdhG (YjbR/CyaY superfamily)